MIKQVRFETFEGRQNLLRSRQEPRVTLGRKNDFYLNAFAYEALGSPRAVEMLYDGDLRIIGLKPTDPARRNAFRIATQGKNNYKRIAAGSFCKHFRINTERTLLFENIDVNNDGVMMLDLNQTIAVGRGSR